MSSMQIVRTEAGAEASATPELLTAEVVAPLSQTLFQIEDELAAWLDTAEVVTPEAESAFLVEMAAALDRAIDKRDRVGDFLAHLDAQVAAADMEIERLQERKRSYCAALDRMEGYLVRIIRAFGVDAKGRYRKLEGKRHTLGLRACPASVEITDELAVPAEFKRAAVRMPLALWTEVLDGLDFDLRGRVLDAVGEAALSVARAEIKDAIKAGAEVEGADLCVGKHNLKRS